MIRALARDRVPLSAVDTMIEAATAETTSGTAIARVRRELWSVLPGNGAAHRRLPPPAR